MDFIQHYSELLEYHNGIFEGQHYENNSLYLRT